MKNSMSIPSLQDCEELVHKTNSFTMTEFEIVTKKGNILTKSFSYNVSIYEEFCLPYARNLRGITFRADTGELIALPFHKFFNYNENESTNSSIIDNLTIKHIGDKIDGSLIYFYKLNDEIFCRTKKSTSNNQIINSMKLYNSNKNLQIFIKNELDNNRTPMFEYISPSNRIVIFYENEELKYLGSRNIITGEYLLPKDNENVSLYNISSAKEIIKYKSLNEIKNACKELKNIEGFVITFTNGEMVKIKTEEYFKLHKLKCDITNHKNLLELLISGQLDDSKSLCTDNEKIYIDNFIKNIIIIKNRLLKLVNDYYNDNLTLSRKDYAIKSKNNFKNEPYLFNLTMLLYANNNEELDNQIFNIILKYKLYETIKF